jgi:hypothetical protein
MQAQFRLGDPALPSLSSNPFHVKHFHPKFLKSPSGGCQAAAGSLLPAHDFCGLGCDSRQAVCEGTPNLLIAAQRELRIALPRHKPKE